MTIVTKPGAEGRHVEGNEITTLAALEVCQIIPVRQPEKYANDDFVAVRLSELRRTRQRLSRLKDRSFPWKDIYLAVSTLCLSAYLSSLLSKLSWFPGAATGPVSTSTTILFDTVLPTLGGGAIVAFACSWRIDTYETACIAREVLSDLPDPEESHVDRTDG